MLVDMFAINGIRYMEDCRHEWQNLRVDQDT